MKSNCYRSELYQFGLQVICIEDDTMDSWIFRSLWMPRTYKNHESNAIIKLLKVYNPLNKKKLTFSVACDFFFLK
jgi:hypothetical protein